MLDVVCVLCCVRYPMFNVALFAVRMLWAMYDVVCVVQRVLRCVGCHRSPIVLNTICSLWSGVSCEGIYSMD